MGLVAVMAGRSSRCDENDLNEALPNSCCIALRHALVCICMKPLTVLIIEDDALIGLLLAELLAVMGHVVCATAMSEAEAIDAARRHKPDLLIADGRLRSGDGVSAVIEILRHAPVPHFFVSGAPGDIVARYPAAIVVRKPFGESSLATAIDDALQAASTA